MIKRKTPKLHTQQTLESIAQGIAKPIVLPREVIEAALRQAMIDGLFEPGEWLMQHAVAEAFHVSRMPAREALRSLETQGYIVSERYKGYLVTNGNEPLQYGHLPGLLRRVAEHHMKLGDLESKVAFENDVLRVLGQLRPDPAPVPMRQ